MKKYLVKIKTQHNNLTINLYFLVAWDVHWVTNTFFSVTTIICMYDSVHSNLFILSRLTGHFGKFHERYIQRKDKNSSVFSLKRHSNETYLF